MHWFWRLILSVAVGTFFAPIILREITQVSPLPTKWQWYWDQVFALIIPMSLPVAICLLLSEIPPKRQLEPLSLGRKVLLHWSVRWGFSLFMTGIVGLALLRLLLELRFYRVYLYNNSAVPVQKTALLSGLLMFAFLGAVPLGIYTLLTRITKTHRSDETRCRKCGYILRGITEPRCPECGERI